MTEDGRLLIIRFSPFTADKCRANAEATYRDDLNRGLQGRYGVSTSGVLVHPDESVEGAIVRLRSIVPLRGKHVAPVWAADLNDRGWSVVPDEPPDAHYLVGKGDLTEMPDFADLALIWADVKRVCPTWGR